MKVVKIIVAIFLVAFVGIQFIPRNTNLSDIKSTADFMLVNKVPSEIEAKLRIACYDCHSNNTQYPWYNKVQPIAWFLERHISEGKSELNFSVWDSLSNRRKASKLNSIMKQIESGEMPLRSYTILHSKANFSKSEIQKVNQWLTKLKDNLNN